MLFPRGGDPGTGRTGAKVAVVGEGAVATGATVREAVGVATGVTEREVVVDTGAVVKVGVVTGATEKEGATSG